MADDKQVQTDIEEIDSDSEEEEEIDSDNEQETDTSSDEDYEGLENDPEYKQMQADKEDIIKVITRYLNEQKPKKRKHLCEGCYTLPAAGFWTKPLNEDGFRHWCESSRRLAVKQDGELAGMYRKLLLENRKNKKKNKQKSKNKKKQKTEE